MAKETGTFGRTRNFGQVTVIIGLSLCVYTWYQWNQLPIPSGSELEAKVETRYQQEIASMQKDAGGVPLAITPEWRDKFHAAIRKEQLAPYEDLKRPVYGFLALGLFTLVIGLGSMVSQKLDKTSVGKG
jgi:hypothetical protein